MISLKIDLINMADKSNSYCSDEYESSNENDYHENHNSHFIHIDTGMEADIEGNIEDNIEGNIEGNTENVNVSLIRHEKIRTHNNMNDDVLYFEDLVRGNSMLYRFQQVFYTITFCYLLFSMFFVTSILTTIIYIGYINVTFHSIMSHQYMPFITFAFYIAVSCVILWLRQDAVIRVVNYITHFTLLISIVLCLSSLSLFFETLFFVLVSASLTLTILMLLLASRYDSCNIMNNGPYNISLISSIISTLFFVFPIITSKLALATTLLMSAWISWTIIVFFIFHLHKIMEGKHIRYSYSVYDGMFCSTNLFIEWGNYIIVFLNNLQSQDI